MPYFSIDTNQTLDQASTQEIMKKASSLIAGILGKSESYVMISIKPGTPLTFAGTNDPAAFVRLKSIGFPKDRCSEFSEKICGFIAQELGVPQDRIFIDFKDLERNLFGWNGKTF
jgi:phenylpyruvate tautomerase PptA (4-oxalocrotonate tautomerase family)